MEQNRITTETAVDQFDFVIGGEKGRYQVSFLINGDVMKTNCTCKHPPVCWHVEYILAGKTARIIGGDYDRQDDLIKKAENTAEGRYLIRKANKKFEGETHCRRCSSPKIIKLKTSLSARFITIFRETKNHTYYCRDCKWTW